MPGLQPHPMKGPGGHMVGAPPPPTWHPDTPWTEDTGYLRGCDLFDNRFYWEAHEAWEGVWHQVPEHLPYRTLLQGLIQAAAAILKRHLGQAEGAERLRVRSTEKIVQALSGQAARVYGMDLTILIERLDAYHQGGPWPLLPTDAL